MNAATEAKRLVMEFKANAGNGWSVHIEFAKTCAIICVDEIIKVLEESNAAVGSMQLKINYWQEVKKEIEIL